MELYAFTASGESIKWSGNALGIPDLRGWATRAKYKTRFRRDVPATTKIYGLQAKFCLQFHSKRV